MVAVEQPIKFLTIPEAHTLITAQEYSALEIQSLLAAYVIRAADWASMTAAEEDARMPGLLFSEVLDGQVKRSPVTYHFDGPQPYEAHVDEHPEDLLAARHLGMFNMHVVNFGSVSTRMVYTKPGYYSQDTQSRTPVTSANYGITQDLLRGKLINTYTSSTQVYQTRLNKGDRVIFFERTAPDVSGPPNVIHLFYQGTVGRLSTTNRYYTEAVA
jgi:hypothetical protein